MIHSDDHKAANSKGVENVNAKYNTMWFSLVNVNNNLTNFIFQNAAQTCRL